MYIEVHEDSFPEPTYKLPAEAGFRKKSIIVLGLLLLLSGCHVLEENPEQESLIRAADKAYSSGKPKAAIPIYQKALSENPDNLELHLKLGKSLQDVGELEPARKVFEQALTIDEEDKAKKELGRTYLLAGQSDIAIPIFEEIIKKDPHDYQGYNALGVAYDLKGDHSLAQEWYRKALQLRPESSDIKSNLGLSLAFMGKFDQSLKLLTPLGMNVKANPKQRHNLAIALYLSGQETKAKELMLRDVKKDDVDENMRLLKELQMSYQVSG